MGGSGGGGGSYTGGGYGGGGSGGGAGGGAGDNPDGGGCQIAINTTLSSPNPAVVPTLQTGNILPVVLNDQSGTPVVQVLAQSGSVAGTLAGIPNLRTLIDCINKGHDYVFVVSTIVGSRVSGKLRNA